MTDFRWDAPYTVQCGRRYDPLARKVVTGGWFLVRDGRVDRLEPEGPPPEGPPVLDLSAFLLTPGLIDGHVHLMLPADNVPPESYLAQTSRERLAATVVGNLLRLPPAGVTAVCDLGSLGQSLLELRRHLERFSPGLPRILASGAPLTQTGGHMAYFQGVADDLPELLKKARLNRAAGAELLKVVGNGGGTAYTRSWVPYYGQAELQALAAEAHLYDQKACLHAGHREAIRRAVAAGFDSLEHCNFLSGPNTIDPDPRLIEDIVRAGVWVAPTLSAVHEAIALYRGRSDLNPAEKAWLEGVSRLQENNLQTTARLHRSGVNLLAGTDAGWRLSRFGDYQTELVLLCSVGLTAEEALYAATLGAARARGLHKSMGSLGPGTLADFSLFETPGPEKGLCFPLKTAGTFIGGQPAYVRADLGLGAKIG